MIIDLNDFDLIKGITRSEAKSVHKDLPPGGSWRTIKGHHIYIKDGKVLAGSIPGVTKAKKATKAHLADHQATIDAEGKKSNGSKTDAKSKGNGKASKPAGKKSGSDSKGAGGAQKAKDSGSGTKASKVGTKGKANESTKVGAKTNDKSTAKPTAKKPTAKPSGTGKPVSTSGAKKGASEGDVQSNTAATTGAGVDDHFELFHGTALPKLDNILKNGFKPNGGHADFGDAAYFKSPTYDGLDYKDHTDWIKERQAKGKPVPERYLTERGNDSEKIVKFFKDKKNPVVIKALIPKEHVLDCTNGRPKELQAILKDHFDLEGEGTIEAMMGFAMKHLLGVNTKGMNEDQLYEMFNDRKKDIDKVWGRDLKPFKVSPYEVYAKKHGVKAIVDKLDSFKEEGWQIGVYDPKVIQIKDHGKDISYNHDKKTAELIKALMKALAKAQGNAPYCLLHHTIDDEGLHLHVGASEEGEEMEKSLTRTAAKAVHKDLPPGGVWRTIKGHHIYLKDGKVLAGSIPGVTKAKKATKAQLAEHQKTVDAENKAKKKVAPPKKRAPAKKEPQPPTKKEGKKDDKKVPTKPKAPAKGAKRGSTAKPSPATAKPAKPSTAKKPSGTAKPKVAPPAKKGKDIRTEAQKNRELAYDVGDKVGGARKDEFIAGWKANPTVVGLEELEKMGGAIAEKMVTKANILPKYDFQQEHDKGVDLPTAILKKLMQDRIAPKPDPSTPESRKAYMAAMRKVQRHFEGIKSFDKMSEALREVSVMARQAKAGAESIQRLAYYREHPERFSYINVEHHEQRIADGKKANGFMDFQALGEKFYNMLTNYESLNRSIDTVRKNTKEGWDKYLTPQAKAAPKKKGEENKRWEREAVTEHSRKGGKETKVKKPEDLMKEFNLRGVEFGHWVNDSSGLFHLKRSAEAFDDLADIIGVDKKDISLNGRLAIAFGARGKSGAAAHYEPDRKVINMTKYGGAGSLAHEWGHALDNVMQQYSNGGQDTLGLASQGQMGNSDPKLKALYDNVMDAISKPAPGDKGGSVQMLLDSEAKSLTRYYPEMRRQINSDMKPEEVYNHWASKINEQYDRYIRNTENGGRMEADKAKQIKKYEQQRNRELKDIGHYMAHELRLKQNGGKYGGDHYKGHIEISTGKSEYMTRMEENQPGKKQNGVHYWSAPEEMFARVFESYIQDTMKKQNRSNNYLVTGTSEGAVKAAGAPFPIGKERAHMHKAMKNLIDYISKKGALKKALLLEVLASGSGDLTEELRKSMGSDTGVERKRSAYNVANPSEVLYIPVNRLNVVYQTEAATNWDKVEENRARMRAGENLEPVVIGLNYDVHDGHHRYEGSKLEGYEHIPCIVKGGNDLDRERALEAYREVWKSIQPDPTNDQPKRRPVMYRGVGLHELNAIHRTGYIQSKGKGNDDDKGTDTCFSNLWSQAEGYARSQYDLYNEKYAFVLTVWKEGVEEDEHGELIAHQPIPKENIVEVTFIGREHYKNQ